MDKGVEVKNEIHKAVDTLVDSKENTNTTNASDVSLSHEFLSSHLKEMVRRLTDKEVFEVGQVVIWKEGLKNKKFPQYSQLCIVTKLHSPVLEDRHDPNYSENLDIELGFVQEGDFFCFNFDSARFTLYK